MSRTTQTYFGLVIGNIFITGLIFPYYKSHFINSDRTQDYYIVKYGWELTHVQLIFVISIIITSISFIGRIALRLLVIRILIALFIPLLFTTIIIDSSFLFGSEYAPIPQVGCYLTYLGALLTIIFGVIHFRSSYPVFKNMLNQSLKEESDVLD